MTLEVPGPDGLLVSVTLTPRRAQTLGELAHAGPAGVRVCVLSGQAIKWLARRGWCQLQREEGGMRATVTPAGALVAQAARAAAPPPPPAAPPAPAQLSLWGEP